MFEKAARLQLRFDSPKGPLTVEDLWNLPLTSVNPARPNLDEIARGLHKQLKSGEDVSFVLKEKKSDAVVQLKFDIVKHIIDVRLTEAEAAALVRSNAEKKQKIMALIADKQDEELKGKSLEELNALVASLNG